MYVPSRLGNLTSRFVTALDIEEVQFVWHFTEKHNFTRLNPLWYLVGDALNKKAYVKFSFMSALCGRHEVKIL